MPIGSSPIRSTPTASFRQCNNWWRASRRAIDGAGAAPGSGRRRALLFSCSRKEAGLPFPVFKSTAGRLILEAMPTNRPFARVLDRLNAVGLRPTRQRLALARLLFEQGD